MDIIWTPYLILSQCFLSPSGGAFASSNFNIKGVVYLRGFKKSNFFLLISNLDTIRNMPYEGYIRKHSANHVLF